VFEYEGAASFRDQLARFNKAGRDLSTQPVPDPHSPRFA
jgi:hypothetical protein